MITSTRNPRVVAAARLHRSRHRRESGQTLCEGPNLLAAALNAGMVPATVFTLKLDRLAKRAQRAGSTVLQVDSTVMAKLAGTETPRGPVAVCDIPPSPPLIATDTVLLCGVADPGNAGTLIRSAAAFEFQVVATPETVDLWSPKVLRSAAGAHFTTPVVIDTEPAAVAATGVALVALVPRDSQKEDPDPAGGPLALMVGNEAHGLTAELVALAETTLTVPTSDAVESLNAAVAGSIAMFAIAQGR